jgi:ankyrin repeat protein
MSNATNRVLAMAMAALIWNGFAHAAVIHEAAAKGDVATVEAKLKDDPDWIDETDGEGRTPLQLAAENGRLEVAKLLLARNANVNARIERGWKAGCTPLFLAIEGNHKEMIELLLSHGAEVDLFAALGLGDTGKVRQLLEARPELISAKGPYGKTPLHWAVVKGNAEAVAFLLLHNADVNAKLEGSYSPVQEAAERGYKEIVGLLLDHKADVNDATGSQRLTPLHLAATKGNKDVVELLLARNADVNARDNQGHTPLHWATGHKDVADLLRAHGGTE